MKHNNFSGGIMTVCLPALVAFSGVGCMATAFGMTVEHWFTLAVSLLAFAGLCLLALRFRWGYSILLALSAGACLFTATLWLPSLERLLYTVSRRYDAGYGWGWIGWSYADLSSFPYEPALFMAGCLVIIPIIWTLCRRKWMLPGAVAGLLPLVVCCVVTSTVPHILFLMLLIAGILLLLLTRLPRRISGKTANRLTALLLIPALLFSALVLTFAQKDPHSAQAQALQDWFAELIGGAEPSGGGFANAGISSASAEVDLQNTGPRQLSDTVVMTVETKYSAILYLRGQAYSTYTGTRWVADADTANEGGWPTAGLEDRGDVTVTTKSNLSLKFFPYYPGGNDWPSQLEDGVLRHPSRRKNYTLPWMTATENAQFTPLSSREQAIYLTLPEDTRNAALELLSTLPDSTDTVAAIAEYVGQSAAYDLNTPAMPAGEEDFALWFLQNSDTGYCVHFASAATVLLRAAGIPARYVTGYATNAQADARNIITADLAHAWVEYLDPDRGWTVLDVTPGIEFVPQTEATETTAPTETQPTEATRPSQTQPAETTASTLPPNTTPPTEVPQLPIWRTGWFRSIFWVLLALAAVFLQYGLRLQYRRKRFTRGTVKQQALAQWKYARRMARLTKQKPPEQLQSLAEKAVFSQHELTNEELAQFRPWIRNAHRTLLKKPLPLRLLLKLILAI